MHNDGKCFLLWRDTQPVVFFNPKLLGLHVSSVMHNYRFIFFASITFLNRIAVLK
jgi:hypothetical protein